MKRKKICFPAELRDPKLCWPFGRLGADINKADDYGRTSLHVAASADYPEMVRFLIDNGANFHLTTKGEAQTPLHFAAKNEASQCVKILLAYGAVLEVRDYKQRTPLQVSWKVDFIQFWDG